MPISKLILLLAIVILAAGLTIWGVSFFGWPVAVLLPATLLAALLVRRL